MSESKLDNSELKLKVIKIVAEKLNIDANKISPESKFQEDLGADSLDVVELLMEFEEQCGISIPDEVAEKLQTVGDAIKYISENT